MRATKGKLAQVPRQLLVEPAGVPWPRRPGPDILSESIPLFFISPDSDGFWIACESDLRIGGIFVCQCSAIRFAERRAEPIGCATITLSEPHALTINNEGNPFVPQLRSLWRLLKRLDASSDAYQSSHEQPAISKENIS